MTVTIYVGRDKSLANKLTKYFEKNQTDYEVCKIKQHLNEHMLDKIFKYKGDVPLKEMLAENDFQEPVEEIQTHRLKKMILENPCLLKTPIVLDWDKLEKGIQFSGKVSDASVYFDRGTKKEKQKELLKNLYDLEMEELISSI